LFLTVDSATFLALPAFHDLTHGFRALRGSLPVLTVRVALEARSRDKLCLLANGFAESGQKSLIVAKTGAADPLASARCEVACIAELIRLELRQFSFAF
jgi:hypothetical protein